MKTRFFQCVLLGLAGLLASCTGNTGDPGMTTGHRFGTNTVCIGRYAIDIPVQLRRQQKALNSGGDVTFYFGHGQDFTKVDATVLGSEGTKTFESAVLAREVELQEKQNFSTDGPMLLSRETVDPDVELISSFASADSTDAVRIEVHALRDGAHVVLAETAYSADARAAIRSKLVSMLPSLRVAGTADPGFCVGDAIFDLGHDYEEAEITYAGTLDGVPVKLQFDINTFEQAMDEPALVERGEANLEGLGIPAEKLRSGPRTLAGDAGDEWLGAFDSDGRRLHGFYAETRTRAPSRRSPKLLVSMATGDEETASGAIMADEMAVALWDQVLTSLRKRPE